MHKSAFYLYDRNMEPRIHVVNYREVRDHEASWGPRRIPDFELILCIRGLFEFECHESGETVLHHPGEVLTIRPGELHTYRLKDRGNTAFFSCIHLEIDGDIPPRVCSFSPEHAMFELFRRVNQLFQRPTRYSREQIGSLLKIIWLYLLETPYDSQNSIRFQAMLDYLDRHLTAHPTRLDLAREFNITPQRVNAIFKEEMQLSPGDYVHRELAVRAYNMLHDEQLSIKETAEALGFDNPFYFSRIFKKIFGFPPSSA